MLLDPQLMKTLYRELSHGAEFTRVPEQDLVMDGADSVRAYDRGGRADGALAGTYLYHLDQMCEVLRTGDTVLDLGCGPANLLGQLARLNPHTLFVGVDLSRPMLTHAARHVRELGLDNVRLRRDDMSELGTWADGSVDAVVSSMSLHHLPDVWALDRLFAQVARVLKPGGGVYFCDFGRLKRLDSIEYFVGRAARGEEPALVEDYRHSLHAAFSPEELRRAAARHLGARVRVHATRPSPLMVVVKSPPRRDAHALKEELRLRLHALPAARRRDVRQLQFFLRLGGLRSTL